MEHIEEPRKPFIEYYAGDCIFSRCPPFPGKHWGEIAEINADRNMLSTKLSKKIIYPRSQENRDPVCEPPLKASSHLYRVPGQPQTEACEFMKTENPVNGHQEASQLSLSPHCFTPPPEEGFQDALCFLVRDQ